MKRFFSLISAMLVTVTVAAQSMLPVGVVKTADGQKVYNPTTKITVDITAVKTSVTAGPYARYAQKMLGVTAPLASKSECTVTSAVIRYENYEYSEPTATDKPLANSTVTTSNTSNGDGFDKVSVDRLTSAVKSTEDMARDAADRIFALRKCRYDLITGEVGENVYGAGLDAALREIDNMEQELTALFVGKQSVVTITKTFSLDAAKQTDIVCRISDADGIVDASDLSGQPVVAKLTPTGYAEALAKRMQTKLKPQFTQRYVIADNTDVAIFFNDKVLTETTIPVFQNGKYVDIVK